MFTGIIEALGTVINIEPDGNNIHFTIRSPISAELKIDQSLSHNGVCLTVVEVNNDTHTVTAIKETLDKSNIVLLKKGSLINLERAMPANGRFDGHIVQGHVDATAECIEIADEQGSKRFTFRYKTSPDAVLVNKGSITIDGVSLTIADLHDDTFSVAIIPYTLEHTIFKDYRPGTIVNIEWDIIGKYVRRLVDGE